jgi:hypothetical protein
MGSLDGSNQAPLKVGCLDIVIERRYDIQVVVCLDGATVYAPRSVSSKIDPRLPAALICEPQLSQKQGIPRQFPCFEKMNGGALILRGAAITKSRHPLAPRCTLFQSPSVPRLIQDCVRP